MSDVRISTLDQSPVAEALALHKIRVNTIVHSHAARLRSYTLLAAAFAQSEPRLPTLAS